MKITMSAGYNKDYDESGHFTAPIVEQEVDGNAFHVKALGLLDWFSYLAVNCNKPGDYTADDIVFEFSITED